MKTAGLLSLLIALPVFAASKRSDDIKRIHASATVLNEIMHAKDGGIPQDLLQKAYCVGIIPSLKRAGFIVGGKYGKGLITCRLHDTDAWSAPSMIVLESGSIGFQIGGGETDVIFTVMNQGGRNALDKDKVTLGGDVAAMGGPVGREVQAQTDAMMRAQILSWSRSRGIFAGVSLEGASLRPDDEDNQALYGRAITQKETLEGAVPAPAGAKSLYAELARYAPKAQTGG